MALQLSEFTIVSDTSTLLESDQRNLETYQQVQQILGQETVLIVTMKCEDVFSADGLDTIARVSEAFLNQPGNVDVKSLTHSYRPVREGFSFSFVPLASGGVTDKAELEQLRAFCLENPLIRNVMVSPDSTHTILTMTYQRDLSSYDQKTVFRSEVESILDSFRDEGRTFETIGIPLIEEEVRSSIETDIRWYLPIAALLLLLVFSIALRSPRLVLYVFVVLVLVAALTPGFLLIIGQRFTPYTLLLLPLWIGIHLTLLIHIAMGVQRAVVHGASDPTTHMLQSIFKSCFFAAFTTAIGLISLTTSDVRHVREVGLLGALGIVFIFASTFGPGLAGLQLMMRSKVANGTRHSEDANVPMPETDKKKTQPSIMAFNPLNSGTVLWIGSMTTLLVGLAIAGTTRLETDVRLMEFFDEESPTREAATIIDKSFGGYNFVQIEFDSGTTNGVNGLSFLQYIDQVHQFAEEREEVSGTYSYAQILALMNQVWHSKEPDSFKIPESAITLNMFATVLRMQPYPFIKTLCDSDFRRAYLFVRTPDLPASRFLEVLNEILVFAETTKPESVSVSATKGIHSILEADRRIVRSQFRTAGLTILVIGVIMSVLWRSVILSLIAVVINLLPVLLVFGTCGAVGIPLNSITVMLAAIVFGIAVDDTVHFITQWREEISRGHNHKEALRRTFEIKGKPILWTSLVLAAISGLLLGTSFPPIRHFGTLSALAYFGALGAVIVLLPAVLMRCLWRGSVPLPPKSESKV